MIRWEDVLGPVITDPIVVHDERLAPLYLEKLKKRPELRGSLRRPENLAIVTWSNYPEKTLLEECLDYLGLADHVVLGKEVQKFTFTARITMTLDYLKSAACTEDLILWIDSRDAVLLKDPRAIIALLEKNACDALFTSTDYFFPGEKCRAIHDFERSRPGAEHTLTPYLNAGVMIARKDFLIRLLEEAEALVEPPLCPLDPKNDQPIFAFLHQKHYPRLKADSTQEFSLRPFMNDVYLFAMERRERSLRNRLEQTWVWQVLAVLKQAVTKKTLRSAVARYLRTPYDTNPTGWMVKKRLLRLKALFKVRGEYTRVIRVLRESEWMRVY